MTATKAVVASLCGIVVLLFGVPPAMATNSSGVLATIPTPSCCAVDEVAAAGGVVSLSFNSGGPERATLSRSIWPPTTVTATLRLPPGQPSNTLVTSSLVFAAGSLQVSFDGSDVLVSLPGSGRVAHTDPASQRSATTMSEVRSELR